MVRLTASMLNPVNPEASDLAQHPCYLLELGPLSQVLIRCWLGLLVMLTSHSSGYVFVLCSLVDGFGAKLDC